MKQTDIVTMILVAGIGMLASFLLINHFMGDPDEESVTFKKMSSVITADLKTPDPEIFNVYAINPTIEMHVGDCDDLDGNGLLDDSELIACGLMEAPESTEDEEQTDNNDSGEEAGEE